ncbi:MAG: hypothetical protein JXQ97_11995 [Natronospirillum sp.]
MKTFQCQLNVGVEEFLTSGNAVRFEKSDISRTYLFIRSSSHGEFPEILAYFSLSFKELDLKNTELSKTKIKKMDGMKNDAEKIIAYLIGQIGKNSAISHNPINLKIILSEIYSVIAQVKELIGGRIIILDCEEPLIHLYNSHGFESIKINEDNSPKKSEKLHTMFTFIKPTF